MCCQTTRVRAVWHCWTKKWNGEAEAGGPFQMFQKFLSEPCILTGRGTSIRVLHWGQENKFKISIPWALWVSETAFVECTPEGGWQSAGRSNFSLFAFSWGGRLAGVWRQLQAAITHIIFCYPHKRSCDLQGCALPRGEGGFICVSSHRWVLLSLGRGQPGCYCMLRLLPWSRSSAPSVVSLRGGQ